MQRVQDAKSSLALLLSLLMNLIESDHKSSGLKKMATSILEIACVNSYRRPLKQESKIGQTPWRHRESKGRKIASIDWKPRK